MNTILEQFSNKINGTFSFFDRMILKGHLLQLFSSSGRSFFLSEMNVLLKDFPSYANQVTNDIVSHVENMAASQMRPLVFLTSAKIPKEQTALDILKDTPVSEGLICILSVVENYQTFQPVKQPDGLLTLRSITRECKYYYFYFLDKSFSFMHVNLQTWFPFMIQVYINGQETVLHAGYHWCAYQCEYEPMSCLRAVRLWMVDLPTRRSAGLSVQGIPTRPKNGGA